MRTTIHRPLLLGLLLLLGACKSNEDKAGTMSVDAAAVPCICGTPEAAFDGCPHPLCLSGKGNPDNPECVCGPLTLGDEDME